MTKEQRFARVWDAIEPSAAEAASMKARSDVLMAIRKIVDGWEVTQSDAAKRLDITQPRLNDLLRGRIDKFSLDALVDIASRAGLSVRVKTVRCAA
jgi:predicted XRE-type DNA-binding protein